MTLILAKEFTGLEGSLGQSSIVYDNQGTSWGATNSRNQVLFVWIATISGSNRVVGRVDGRGHNDNTIASPVQLSTSSGVEGVRCCYNPGDAGWIIVYNVGTTVYYRTFSNTLSATSSETALPTVLPSGYSPDIYNLGCNEDGDFYVSWPERIIKVDASTGTVLKNYAIEGGNRMHVHVHSGSVDVTRFSGDVLVVDRYCVDIDFLYTVYVDTSTTFNSSLHGITGRYGDEGFWVAYVDGSGGNNIKYRGFTSDGTPLSSVKTVPGTGNIDISSNQGRFFLTIGERPLVDQQWYTLVIRATSKNGSSNRSLILIEPQRFNHQTIDKIEVLALSDSDNQYGQPVAAATPWELRSLKPELTGTVSMSMEAYVRQSVWMSLWKIETTGRVFVSPSLDNDSKGIVEAIYTTYPSGNKLAGSTGVTDAEYTGSSGRGAVNPDTTAFSSYWGTATTEDNVFVGGPVTGEIMASFENNPNHYDPQISTLSSELGVSSIEWITDGRTQGWNYGSLTPELNVSIGGITYQIERHMLSEDNYYQESEPATISVDYAYIVRLPLTTTSTQTSRAHIYISGINKNGTEAAAYVLSNAITYNLGASLAHLVVLEYDQTITTTGYVAGSTGNIRTYPLSTATTTNFEGIR